MTVARPFDIKLPRALSSDFKTDSTLFKIADDANRSNPPLSVLLLQLYVGVSMSELN
jgi:hypothetical protein